MIITFECRDSEYGAIGRHFWTSTNGKEHYVFTVRRYSDTYAIRNVLTNTLVDVDIPTREEAHNHLARIELKYRGAKQ
jgi:hypothetical protein